MSRCSKTKYRNYLHTLTHGNFTCPIDLETSICLFDLCLVFNITFSSSFLLFGDESFREDGLDCDFEGGILYSDKGGGGRVGWE